MTGKKFTTEMGKNYRKPNPEDFGEHVIRVDKESLIVDRRYFDENLWRDRSFAMCKWQWPATYLHNVKTGQLLYVGVTRDGNYRVEFLRSPTPWTEYTDFTEDQHGSKNDECSDDLEDLQVSLYQQTIYEQALFDEHSSREHRTRN